MRTFGRGAAEPSRTSQTPPHAGLCAESAHTGVEEVGSAISRTTLSADRALNLDVTSWFASKQPGRVSSRASSRTSSRPSSQASSRVSSRASTCSHLLGTVSILIRPLDPYGHGAPCPYKSTVHREERENTDRCRSMSTVHRVRIGSHKVPKHCSWSSLADRL